MNQQTHEIELPDGRTLHVLVMNQSDHVCVDIWTTDGQPFHGISGNTADPSRAPMGIFTWRAGTRRTVSFLPTPESHGWPAVSTVSVLWDKYSA